MGWLKCAFENHYSFMKSFKVRVSGVSLCVLALLATEEGAVSLVILSSKQSSVRCAYFNILHTFLRKQKMDFFKKNNHDKSIKSKIVERDNWNNENSLFVSLQVLSLPVI